MAIKARDVMDPDVDDERMTCRKGWSSAGVSKILISRQIISSCISYSEVEEFKPLHCFKSLLNRVNADMSGLSCMLLPFLPRKPHLPPSESSSCGVAIPVSGPLRPSTYEGTLVELPPKIAV